jgi:hypothetical protein
VGLIFLVLSLGPTLKIYSLDTGLPLPYAWLAGVPPFNVGRSPVRFVAMAAFFWMIMAAYGVQWLQSRSEVKYGLAVSAALMALIFAWTTAEVYSPLIDRQEKLVIPAQLGQIVAGPVLELPLGLNQGWTLLFQIFHKQPLAIGEVSRQSREQLAHYETLRVLYAEAVQTGSCEKLMKLGYRNVIVRSGVTDDIVKGLRESPRCQMNVVDLR